MDYSPENGLDWLKQNWQFLVIFHYILHYTVYYARITVIKMQNRVNFLVYVYTILQYGQKMQKIKMCNLGCAQGTVVAQWLRCCATYWKVAGLIPAGVIGFFIDIKPF